MKALTVLTAVFLALAFFNTAVVPFRFNYISSGEYPNQTWLFNNLSVIEAEGINYFAYALNSSESGGLYTNAVTILDPSLLFHFSFENQSQYFENDTKVVGFRTNNMPVIINGTVIGGNVTTANGKYGRGMQFLDDQTTGTRQYVISSNQTLKTGMTKIDNYTLSLWINPHSLASSSSYGSEIIISDSLTYLWIQNLKINYYDTSTATKTGTISVSNNTWTFITLVVNSTKISIYVNNQLDNSFAKGANSYLGQLIYFGGRPDAPWNFNGTIDEAKVWNRSLTETEIRYQYYSDLRRLYESSSIQWQFVINETSLIKGNYSRGFEMNNSLGYISHALYPLNTSLIKPTAFQCFDEQNPSIKLTFNLTIAGTTNYNTQNYTVLTTPVSDSNVEYRINEITGAYLPRVFQLNGNQSVNQTCYLLKTSASSIVRIKVLTYGDSLIANALVNVSRMVGSVLNTVDMQYTDATGTAAFYLDPLTSYTFTISATGYTTGVTSFQPSSNDYRIYLTSGQSLGTFNAFYNVSYYFTPENLRVNISDAETLSFTLFDLSAALEYYGLMVYWNNTLVFYNLDTNPSGGTMATSLNTTAYEGAGRLDVVGFFKKTDFDEINISVSMGLMDTTPQPGSLEEIFKMFSKRTNNNLMPVFGVISLIIAASTAVFIAGNGSFVGGGIIAVIILGISSLMGWLPFLVWTTTAITVGAIMLLRGRL